MKKLVQITIGDKQLLIQGFNLRESFAFMANTGFLGAELDEEKSKIGFKPPKEEKKDGKNV